MDESSSQIMEESVEVGTTVLQERISERICEQSGVIEVSRTSSQDRILQRTVEQILDESVVAVRSVHMNECNSKLPSILVDELDPQIMEEFVEVVSIPTFHRTHGSQLGWRITVSQCETPSQRTSSQTRSSSETR